MDTPKTSVLGLSRLAASPWVGRENALRLLQVFEQFDEQGLALQRYGTAERHTFPIEGNLDKFLLTWNQHRWCIFKSRKPWNLTVVATMGSPTAMYPRGRSDVTVHIKEQFFESEARTKSFLELAKALYQWGQMDYGCVHNEDEYKEKNVLIQGPVTWYGGGRLDQMLPGIYWANFFGPRYVKWFGETKFTSLPGFSKERLSDGGWLILTRPSPTSPRDDTARQLERTIIERLGEDAFFDKEKLGKRTIAPPFVQG
jgi:hypothetical protein